MGYPFNKGWPRYLASSCGIGASEQYRYVAMSAAPERRIDWSHEREWRWVDHEDKYSCPGLPIWLSGEPASLSRIFVVVPNSTDAQRVLDRLQELYDAGTNDFNHLFCKRTLKATSVIALDQLATDFAGVEGKLLRLDDIPAAQIRSFKRPAVSSEFIERVRHVLEEAQSEADKAAQECLKSAPRAAGGQGVADVAGWAHLIVYDAQSPLVSALLQLEEASPIPGTGYYIHSIGGLGWGNDQALSLAETAVKAARLVFEKHFPDASFGMETRWD